MAHEQWQEHQARCIGLLLAGDAGSFTTMTGEPDGDDTLLLVCNAHGQDVPFTMPDVKRDVQWRCLLDTAHPERPESEWCVSAGGTFNAEPCSATLFALVPRH
jgi:glycogen operon protein